MNKISDILAPTGVHVSRLTYSGNSDPYITYFLYNEQGEAFAENKEIVTSYYVQVDIWTKNDFSDLYNQVLDLMTKAGFYRTFAIELYENDTRFKHKLIRFQYTQECQ